jgi:hypothetical protein
MGTNNNFTERTEKDFCQETLTRNNCASFNITRNLYKKVERVGAQLLRSARHNISRGLHSGSVSVHEFLFLGCVPSAHCLIVAGYSGPPFHFVGATVGALLKNGRSNFSAVAADS